MAGAYCRYCGNRCFVYREVITNGARVWSGHMATCAEGAAWDRKQLGVDFQQARNPVEEAHDCLHTCCADRFDPHHDHFLTPAQCPSCV